MRGKKPSENQVKGNVTHKQARNKPEKKNVTPTTWNLDLGDWNNLDFTCWDNLEIGDWNIDFGDWNNLDFMTLGEKKQSKNTVKVKSKKTRKLKNNQVKTK